CSCSPARSEPSPRPPLHTRTLPATRRGRAGTPRPHPRSIPPRRRPSPAHRPARRAVRSQRSPRPPPRSTSASFDTHLARATSVSYSDRDPLARHDAGPMMESSRVPESLPGRPAQPPAVRPRRPLHDRAPARPRREAAEARDSAHRHGVIHRDVKPENILLTEGHSLLADFGIARALQGSDRLTETGMAVGTPAYMSPEQASGEHALDARTDVYALGCVLYEMLAGHPPFLGSTAREIVAR